MSPTSNLSGEIAPAPEPQPRIRAAYVRLLIEAGVRHERGRDIVTAMPPDVLARIRGAGRMGFVSGADHLAIAHAIYDVAGVDATTEAARMQTSAFGRSPLMASTIKTLLHLVGMRPGMLLRHSLLFRNAAMSGFGIATYRDHGVASGRMALARYPSALFDDASVACLRGATLGIVDLTDHDGETSVVALDRDAGRLELEVRWRPRR